MNASSALSIKDVEVTKWLYGQGAFALPQNKVVAIHAFQMLCPGCVLHGVPQASKLDQFFNREQVQVLGLHTVFEHHEAMQEASLRAFLHEFRVQIPVGIDVAQNDNRIPVTMEKFGLQGTPSWLLFNRKGELSANLFGQVEDAVVASMITQLIYSDNLDRGLLVNNQRRNK